MKNKIRTSIFSCSVLFLYLVENKFGNAYVIAGSKGVNTNDLYILILLLSYIIFSVLLAISQLLPTTFLVFMLQTAGIL